MPKMPEPTEMTAANVDREKVKTAYTRQIISLEILKLKEMPDTVEQAEKLYDEVVTTRTYLIDDLASGTPYVIRVAHTDNKNQLKTVDPDHIEDCDVFEIQESIQDIYRELKLPIIKSNFQETPEVPAPGITLGGKV